MAKKVSEMTKALKAFKRRLRIYQDDAASSMAPASHLSGKKTSQIIGIKPPDAYPREIWDKLVEQGRLKKVGTHIYALP